MRVVNGENSRYTLFDLITNKKKDYHVSDMKPFIFNADLVDPVDIARRDYMEFFIENVISYRGNLKRKTELEFQIKWLGYDETHNSWEPYANLRDSDQYFYIIYKYPFWNLQPVFHKYDYLRRFFSIKNTCSIKNTGSIKNTCKISFDIMILQYLIHPR